ncbi:Hypothetical protein BFF96_1985 [Corynebacterium pseudotuberculosis]|nr:Hypothetical protein BFF96_1985 [Corynebacterium pseudotuberculosis]
MQRGNAIVAFVHLQDRGLIPTNQIAGLDSSPAGDKNLIANFHKKVVSNANPPQTPKINVHLHKYRRKVNDLH